MNTLGMHRLFAALLLASACGSAPTGGGGGAAGTLTSSSTASSSGSRSTSSSSSSSGAACLGNATTWATLTTGPIACTKNSDCCVIHNDCLSESQVVPVSGEAAAKAAWPYCSTSCVPAECGAQPIDVGCTAGFCLGKWVWTNPPADLFADHCGDDTTPFQPGPDGGPDDGPLSFMCGI